MKLATPRDAEFGLRAAPNELSNIVLLLARYVGGRGRLTSNDTAEFLYPELFRDSRHHRPRDDVRRPVVRPLAGEAEYEMMDRFVTAMGRASLLCDLVDAETVGLENALRVMKAHPETDERRHPRRFRRHRRSSVSSTSSKMRDMGLTPRLIVFEDEVTPEVVQQGLRSFPPGDRRRSRRCSFRGPAATGGGWSIATRWRRRSSARATGDHPNVKFSNSPGKESLGGYLRVYGRDDTLIVADASEPPQGEPLFVKLVEQGPHCLSRESFDEQADRADRTWGRYKRCELSPKVHEYQDRFRAMQAHEVADAKKRLSG